MEKPTVQLIGSDSNIFSIVGKCSSALKKVGQHDQAKKLTEKVFKSSSYNEALSICMDYVKVE